MALAESLNNSGLYFGVVKKFDLAYERFNQAKLIREQLKGGAVCFVSFVTHSHTPERLNREQCRTGAM
jgi:hypothetical protein